MRPNVITLLIGLIATLFIWWTQTAQRWAAWIWVAIAVCAVLLAGVRLPGAMWLISSAPA